MNNRRKLVIALGAGALAMPALPGARGRSRTASASVIEGDDPHFALALGTHERENLVDAGE